MKVKKINSRTKGAAFERLIVNKLNAVFLDLGIDRTAKRNLDQAFIKGLADIYIGQFAIECKRYGENKSGNMYKQAWWDQVVSSAGDKLIPVLIYKYNKREIMAVVPGWIVSGMRKDNQVIYMCPLSDLCGSLEDIFKKCL
tara:strand:+ start:248 stop:670 length:423 start_codon:yes stop_codon:yes gene_type:complete